MFYVSAKYHDGVGITDTADGVTERYTYEDIAKIIEEYKSKVHGLVYTGNKYKARVTSPEFVMVDDIGNGSVFLLNGEPVMRVSDNIGSFTIFNGKEKVSLPDSVLLERKCKIGQGVSEAVLNKIQATYCKKYHVSSLAIYLGK